MNGYKKKMVGDKLQLAFAAVEELLNEIEVKDDDISNKTYLELSQNSLRASKNYVNSLLRMLRED